MFDLLVAICYTISMKIELNNEVKEFIKGLDDKIYLVGGFVRNSLLGMPTSDIDVAGPKPAAALKLPSRATFNVINHRMGTAQIVCDDIKIEYTPFRVEVYDKGGEHKPAQVFFTEDLNADAVRRDFCCNAVYYDVNEDKIIDPMDGVADIEKKVLRGCHKRVFESDGLRLLRLVRLASELGFKIENETALSAKANADLLRDIVPQRRRVELDKMLVADTAYGIANAQYRAMRLLKQLDLWRVLLPEVAACEGVMQPAQYHKYDVMEHLFQTVRFATPNIRLAALLHDIGKPYCVEHFGNMHGHEHNSAIMTESFMRYYGYSNELINEVTTLVDLHMYDMRGDTKENKLKLFVVKNFYLIDKLAALCRADAMATGMSVQLPEKHRFIAVKEQLLAQDAPVILKRLRINGDDLKEIGFKDVRIGKLLNELWQQCILEPRLNTRDYLITRAQKTYDAENPKLVL